METLLRKKGMDTNEVRAILGRPDTIKFYPPFVEYEYDFEAMGISRSEIPTVVFDSLWRADFVTYLV